MFCHDCGHKLDETCNYCEFCGSKVKIQTKIVHTQQSLTQDRGPEQELGHCQACMATSPVRYVEFHQNIGMLFRRSSKSIKGRLCKKCINKYFWDYTLTTLAIGWFGTISFFVTPIFIVNNTVRYIGSLSLKQHR